MRCPTWLHRPRNEASWEDIQAVFGTRGDPHRCQCQRFKMEPGESWASVGAEELGHRLRAADRVRPPESEDDLRSRRVPRRRARGVVRRSSRARTTHGCAEDARPLGRQGRGQVGRRASGRSRASSPAPASAVAASAAPSRAPQRTSRGSGAPARSRATRCSRCPARTSPGASSTSAAAAPSRRPGTRRSSHPTPRRVVMRIDF